jgi:hypothetical protein
MTSLNDIQGLVNEELGYEADRRIVVKCVRKYLPHTPEQAWPDDVATPAKIEKIITMVWHETMQDAR